MADKEFVVGIKVDTKESASSVKETNAQLKTMAQAVDAVSKSIKALNLDELHKDEGLQKATKDAQKFSEAIDEINKKSSQIDFTKGKNVDKIVKSLQEFAPQLELTNEQFSRMAVLVQTIKSPDLEPAKIVAAKEELRNFVNTSKDTAAALQLVGDAFKANAAQAQVQKSAMRTLIVAGGVYLSAMLVQIPVVQFLLIHALEETIRTVLRLTIKFMDAASAVKPYAQQIGKAGGVLDTFGKRVSEVKQGLSSFILTDKIAEAQKFGKQIILTSKEINRVEILKNFDKDFGKMWDPEFVTRKVESSTAKIATAVGDTFTTLRGASRNARERLGKVFEQDDKIAFLAGTSKAFFKDLVSGVNGIEVRFQELDPFTKLLPPGRVKEMTARMDKIKEIFGGFAGSISKAIKPGFSVLKDAGGILSDSFKIYGSIIETGVRGIRSTMAKGFELSDMMSKLFNSKGLTDATGFLFGAFKAYTSILETGIQGIKGVMAIGFDIAGLMSKVFNPQVLKDAGGILKESFKFYGTLVKVGAKRFKSEFDKVDLGTKVKEMIKGADAAFGKLDLGAKISKMATGIKSAFAKIDFAKMWSQLKPGKSFGDLHKIFPPLNEEMFYKFYGPIISKGIQGLEPLVKITFGELGMVFTRGLTSILESGGNKDHIANVMVGMAKGFGIASTSASILSQVFSKTGVRIAGLGNILGGFFKSNSAGAAGLSKTSKLILEFGTSVGWSQEKIAGAILTADEYKNSFQKLGSLIPNLMASFRSLFSFVSEGFVKALAGFRAFVAGISGAKIADTIKNSMILPLTQFIRGGITGLTNFARDVKGIFTTFATTGLDFKGAGIIEAVAFLDPLFRSVTSALVGMELPLAETISKFTSFGSIITGVVLVALTKVSAAIGGVMVDIGVKLGNSLLGFEEKGLKFIDVQERMRFVVRKFGDTMGKEVVGDVEAWEQVIGKINNTSVFALDDINKSIKLIIAEGSALGLTFKQNVDLVEAAVQLASAQGKNLDDVTQRLLSGLIGQTAGAATLGVLLNENAIAHASLAGATGHTVGAMSDHEKVQARLNIIMDRGDQLTGAAALSTETLAGKQKLLAKLNLQLQQELGGTAIVTKIATEAQLALTKSLISVPRVLKDIVISGASVGAVLSVLVGLALKFALTMITVVTSLKVFTILLSTNALVQNTVSKAINVVNASLGLQSIQVTSLATLWTALSTVVVQSVMVAMLQVKAVITAVTAKLATMSLALLPLVIKLGILVGLLVAIDEAASALAAELGPIGKLLTEIAKNVGFFAVALGILNVMIIKSTILQTILTTVSTRLGASAGLQTVAVTSLSTAWANFAMIGRAAAASMSAGLIPMLGAMLVSLKAVAVAIAAVLVPLLPLIGMITAIVAVVLTFIVAIDDMSIAFRGFGGTLDAIMLPFAQVLGLTKDLSSATDDLGAKTEETTGIFERLWITLKSAVQLAILPFAFGVALLAEGLLRLKLAITDDVAEVKQLTEALGKNDDVQALLIGSMQLASSGFLSFGNGIELAAKESEIFGHAMLTAEKGIKGAGHHAEITEGQLAGLTEALKTAIGEIGVLQKEMSQVGKNDIQKIQMAADSRIEELEALRDKLQQNKSITSEQEKELDQLVELINKKKELTIEGKKQAELQRITGEANKLERTVTKEKLNGAAAIEKQLEFRLADLDAKALSLKAEGLLTKEIEAQIDRQKALAKATKETQISSLVEKATKTTTARTKVTKAPKAAKEKVSDAQRELESLLKNQIGLQKTINEFGKEGTDLIIMRKNERAKELDLLQKTLVAEGKVGTAQVINLAKAREMKLANLKIDAEADKKKKTADEEKAKAAEKAAATALQLGQTVADRLKQSDKDLASRTQSRIQMIQTETIEQYKSVTAEAAKLDAAGELTPQLARSFAQLKENNLEAAKFDIKEIKTDSIEQLRKDTEALVNEGKTDEQQKVEALKLALAAIDAKRAELKAAGLLTEEAKRLLAVQGKEVRKKGKGGGDDDKDDESIFDQIVEGFEEGTDMIAGAFDGLSGIMDGLADFGGEETVLALHETMESFPEMIAKGMDALPDIMMGMVDSFVTGLETLIDKLPELITNILDMLPEIIDKLFAAFGKLVDSLPAIFEQILDAMPEIIAKIMDKLPEIITKVLNALGDIISSIIEALPEMIETIAERIGPIVEALVEGLVDNMAKIAIELVDTMIVEGGAWRIGVAIVKGMVGAIVGLFTGLVKGMAKALLRIGEAIFGGAGKIEIDWGPVEALPEKIGDAVADVAEGIKAGGGDVFALVDLAKSKAARTIDKAIGQATRKAAQQFKQVFKAVTGWLKTLWLWVWGLLTKLWTQIEMIWAVVVKLLGQLWQIVEKIWAVVVIALQALWTAIEAIWDVVVLALQALWDAIELIWDTVVELLQGLWDAIELIWDNVVIAVQTLWDNIEKIFTDFVEGVQGVWDWFKTNILDKFASGIQTVFDTLATKGQEAADKISGAITKLPEQARQAAEKLSAAINGLPGKATEFANNVISKLGSIGSTMWNSFTSAFGSMGGVIKDHATWAFDELFRNIKGAFGKMFEGVGGGGTGTIEGLMGTDVPIIRFAEGGVVPGTSPFPGDNKKNDSTVALLSPGEAVIPRSILADPEISRLVQSIMGGNVKFAFGGSLPKVSVSAPKISAPKLPSINDIKTMSTADLANNLEANFEALKKLATGDLWDMFKDKIFEQVKSMMESIMKSAAGFEDGGIVPNTGMAMVHENEAVLPTGLVDAIMGTTNNKNQQSQNITLNATVNMVGADISGGKKAGKTIIDEMFTELRKRSANQKIMFQSGLIS